MDTPQWNGVGSGSQHDSTAPLEGEAVHCSQIGQRLAAVWHICTMRMDVSTLASLVAYTGLVWGFVYLPTQDGSSHLNNALMLRDYGLPGNRYDQFFELRQQPVPNTAVHVLLATTMLVLPPLAAEKVIVSAYLAGFALAFLYFADAIEMGRGAAVFSGLLCAYNYAFCLGLYGYLFSCVLFWLVAGLSARRAMLGIRFRDTALLGALLVLSFFTHLVGFFLSCVAIVVFGAPRRGQRRFAFYAALPAVIGMAVGGAYVSMSSPLCLGIQNWQAVDALRSSTVVNHNAVEVTFEYIRHLFGPESARAILGGATIAIILEWYVISRFGLKQRCESSSKANAMRRRAAIFGACLVLAWLVLPDSLGPLGGSLRCRLPPIATLLLLSSARMPAVAANRPFVAVLRCLVLATNLCMVGEWIHRNGNEVAEFCAAMDDLPPDCTVTLADMPHGDSDPDHLLHASSYYCLQDGRINLDNYEAESDLFPLRFRAGVTRRRVDAVNCQAIRAVDIVIAWEAGEATSRVLSGVGKEIFRGQRLRVYRVTPAEPGQHRTLSGSGT